MEQLDLHGLPHIWVRNDVIRFVERYWDGKRHCRIITGMSFSMQKIVTDVLDEYKINYTIGNGMTNFGYIDYVS